MLNLRLHKSKNYSYIFHKDIGKKCDAYNLANIPDNRKIQLQMVSAR